MDIKSLKHTFLAAAMVLLLAACSSLGVTASGEPTAVPPPPQKVDINIVAEGRVIPAKSVQLAFYTSGLVNEVLVKEGDQVTTSQVVARLGDREEIESAIAEVQIELLTAQQARQELFDSLPEQQTSALQALKDARKLVRDAEQTLRGFDWSAEPLDIEVARANVALAKRALEKAEKDYKPYEKKPEDDFRRASFLSRLSEAQERYDDAVRALNRLTGVITPDFDLDQAQTELIIAQARLALAEQEKEELKLGPDPDDLAAVDARIQAAEASLAAAQAALGHLELLSTLNGTVVEQDLMVGEPVASGEPVMHIADFSQMYVETDDLTEIEVVAVAIGQKVTVVVDALPDIELTGTVEAISQEHEEKRGDITYTARIRLDTGDPRLRWGMTVAITFVK
jgi:multidrug resistance efflux pump